MTKEELTAYLRENLKVEVRLKKLEDFYYDGPKPLKQLKITVSIKLDEEVITEDYDSEYISD